MQIEFSAYRQRRFRVAGIQHNAISALAPVWGSDTVELPGKSVAAIFFRIF